MEKWVCVLCVCRWVAINYFGFDAMSLANNELM